MRKKPLPNLLRKMPLRAERLKVEQVSFWQELYHDSIVERGVWKKKVVEWGYIKIYCPKNNLIEGHLYLGDRIYKYYRDPKNIKIKFKSSRVLERICWVRYKFPKKTRRVRVQTYLEIDPMTINYRNLLDFFGKSNKNKFRILIGKKGSGKTFNTLLALNGALKKVDLTTIYDVGNRVCYGVPRTTEFPKFRPCYISFDVVSKRIYIKPISTFALKAPFDLEKCSFDSFEKHLKWANLIVWDEIHYLLEYLIENDLSVKPFVDLLKKVMGRKVKILLISEEPLLFYATILKDKRLDNILLKFGLFPRFGLENMDGWKTQEKLNFLALREMYPFTLRQLWFLNNHYSLNIPLLFLFILSDTRVTVRDLIKLLKILDWNPTFENLQKCFKLPFSLNIFQQTNNLIKSDIEDNRTVFYKSPLLKHETTLRENAKLVKVLLEKVNKLIRG